MKSFLRCSGGFGLLPTATKECREDLLQHYHQIMTAGATLYNHRYSHCLTSPSTVKEHGYFNLVQILSNILTASTIIDSTS